MSATNPAAAASTTEGVFIRPSGQKTFIPLENNPDVFTRLVHTLGVSPELGFFDVYSIDEPELVQLLPRPAHALIFITPSPMYDAIRKTDKGSAEELTYDAAGDAEPVMWFRQTIGHACGLIALLHAVSNGSARSFVLPDSDLDKLLQKAGPLKPAPRAELLYNSEALERAHMDAARTGNSLTPSAAEPIGYHFLAYVKGKNGHMYELEGAWDGPIDRGMLADDEDVLSEKALDMGVRKFIKAGDGNLEFSIVALASKPGGDQ